MLFDENYILQDSAQLRDYYTALYPGVLHKQIDHLDDYAQLLIALYLFSNIFNWFSFLILCRYLKALPNSVSEGQRSHNSRATVAKSNLR